MISRMRRPHTIYKPETNLWCLRPAQIFYPKSYLSSGSEEKKKTHIHTHAIIKPIRSPLRLQSKNREIKRELNFVCCLTSIGSLNYTTVLKMVVGTLYKITKQNTINESKIPCE